MKKSVKFAWTLVLLAVLGGAAFFAGWAQLPVPPGAYGIIRSKTHGVDPEPVREGRFRWLWYRLIPTNTRIEVYQPVRVSRPFKSSGSLPSAAACAALSGAAGAEEDFTWELSGEFSFTLKPAAVPAILEREGVSGQEALAAYAASLGVRAEAALLDRLHSYSDDEDRLEALRSGEGLSALEASLAAAFPETEGFSCVLTAARLPNLALYRRAMALYEAFLEAEEAALETAVSEEGRDQISSRFRLSELGRIGEVLTEYPILIRYLALEKGLVVEE